MKTLLDIGRKFYGICICALGIQQFFIGNFLPVILPTSSSQIPELALFSYLASAALVMSGIAILREMLVKEITLILGTAFIILFGLFHVTFQLFVNPYGNHLAAWSNTFKILALSGGAFVLAGTYPDQTERLLARQPILKWLKKLIPLGSFFFSITMITFGYIHFHYPDHVSKLVPSWIPGSLFWTYFAGLSLIASGVAIIAKRELRLCGILLGTMILLWFVTLHLPRAFADPFSNNGNEVTSAFEALGFSGIAFMLTNNARFENKYI